MQEQLPPHLAALKAHDPKLMEQVVNVQDFVIQEGVLSLKVKTLMMLLCDALLARPHGVKILADRARGLGATEEEIAETVQVAYLFGGWSALFPALNAFEPVQL
ncbi:MAG: carboxymuconolactone decarboxylase family protein [Chloroflexi bacterium]|nr:carboxymuconolactone decarboxylase family protein [Chloroflexota bacterium]